MATRTSASVPARAARPPARRRAAADLPEPPPVGPRVAELRRRRGLTLAQLGARCGMSEAKLSRLENGLASLSTAELFLVARALEVEVTTFFREAGPPLQRGLRAITRAGEGERHESGRYAFELLNADLSAKRMLPSINTITARTLDEAGGLRGHEGEEFIYVLDGILVLHSEFYQPTRLRAGDSIYFAAETGHAYVTAGRRPARILVVTTLEPGATIDTAGVPPDA